MEVEEKEINISESNDLATEQDYYQFKQILLYFVHILRANAELEPFNEGESRAGKGERTKKMGLLVLSESSINNTVYLVTGIQWMSAFMRQIFGLVPTMFIGHIHTVT